MSFTIEEALFIQKIAEISPYGVATVEESYLMFMGMKKVKESFLSFEKKQEIFRAVIPLSVSLGIPLDHCVIHYTPVLPTIRWIWKVKRQIYKLKQKIKKWWAR